MAEWVTTQNKPKQAYKNLYYNLLITPGGVLLLISSQVFFENRVGESAGNVH